MKHVRAKPNALIGYGFVNPSWIPDGLDEYHLRNEQNPPEGRPYRRLTAEEVAQLEAAGNRSSNWDDVLVVDPFLPDLIGDCTFHGLVRIDAMSRTNLALDGLLLQAGLQRATIISCDIGSEVCIRNVGYLAHTIVSDRAVLSQVDECYTTPTARFGCGIIRDGQTEDQRVWIEPVNESGGRQILAAPGMIPADAVLWATSRADGDLLDRLRDITQSQAGAMRGQYSYLGPGAVIRNCKTLRDVHIQAGAAICGASRLDSLTLQSSPEEPTEVTEAISLTSGVAGAGCCFGPGVIADRFILGQHVTLTNSARVIHVVVGDNSTIACCEVLHSLIGCAHEQHHNNSFLIAASVAGQSNIAAGATIGSNHNSRAPDGEIHAERGFWPGLCVSLKHNCRFAAYTLLAKADYPAEIDLPLPFSLLSNDIAHDRLLVMPGYWWLYNAYALTRNSWKFQARDKRQSPSQNIEFHCLAPDTIEQILHGMHLLELWTARARLEDSGQRADEQNPADLAHLGRELLAASAETLEDLTIRAEGIEKSRRECIVLKPHAGYDAYREMAMYYATTNLVDYFGDNPDASFEMLVDELGGPRQEHWVDLGGQIIWAEDLAQIKSAIRSGKLNSWDSIHAEYDRIQAKYTEDRQAHALAVLGTLLGVENPDAQDFDEALEQLLEIQQHLAERVRQSRAKDFTGHFRRMVFADSEEMAAVLGRCEDDGFIRQVQQEADRLAETVEQIRSRL
ncbi:MAG: DUF4954 family protein [Phycisphaerae bacterium]